jgi:uncharacterized membrane protein YfhO
MKIFSLIMPVYTRISHHPLLSYLIISLIVSVYVFFDFIVLDKVYLFKDIGSDSLNVYFPHYFLISQYIHDTHSFPTWSFRQGMGHDIFPASFGNPFNWIYYLIGGFKLSFAIVYVEISKAIISGLLIIKLLKIIKVESISAIIAGLTYSFSGYMIVGGGWYVFSSEAVFFALLLLSIEIYLTSRNWFLIPIAVFFIGADNPFAYFYISLFAVFYLLFKYNFLSLSAKKNYWQDIGKIISYGMLGIGLSAIFSFGQILQMIDSARFSGESSLFQSLIEQDILSSYRHYMTSLYRLFSSDLLGNGSYFSGWGNYLEAPMHYSGLLAIILVPQLFVNFSKQQRLWFLVLLLLTFAILFFPHFRLFFWLFAGDYYRSIALLILAFLILCQTYLLHYYQQDKVQFNPYLLAVNILCCIGILFLPAESDYQISQNIRQLIVVFLVFYTLLLLLSQFKVRKQYIMGLLLLAFATELAVFSHYSVNTRLSMNAFEVTDKKGFNDDSLRAVSFLANLDKGFYRVSKNYYSGPSMHKSFNDAKIQGYFGIASYHSFNHKGSLDFLSSVEVISPSNEAQTRWTPDLNRRPMLQSITSHKYHLSKQPGYNTPPNYTFLKKIGDLTIYKHNNFLALGIGYKSYLRRSAFNKLPIYQKDIVLMNAVVVADNETNLIGLSEFDPKTINVNYNVKDYKNDLLKRQDKIAQLIEFKEHTMHFKVIQQQPLVYFFSIPYDSGWTASIDNKKVPLLKINAGLSGVYVTEGIKQIELTYKPNYILFGSIISGLSLLVYIGLGLLSIKGKRNKPMAQ